MYEKYLSHIMGKRTFEAYVDSEGPDQSLHCRLKLLIL